MPRNARIVVPGVPHHVVQRGNRKQPTFFQAQDYDRYLYYMNKFCTLFKVEVLAYCLMTNHVHLIVVPASEKTLSKAIGEAHRFYTLYINKQFGWKGHLWQGRYFSCPMGDKHALMASRYIELNSVKAGIVQSVVDYPYSSALYHLGIKKTDPLVKGTYFVDQVENWKEYLGDGLDKEGPFDELISKKTKMGQPLGSMQFIEQIKQLKKGTVT